ncbi:MAG: hypothetical protein DA405_02770 [Bacteroidetes bacterium]|nr:MAG: hypothetical protein DA405_02770 [Bacteroidota bacterium]
MIGNDIIDIAYTQKSTNYQRRGFLAKVFTTYEQDIIHQSPHAFTTVWRLWSMKEAAYKWYLQKGGRPFNSPNRIAITLRDNLTGDAQIGGFSVAILSELTKEYTHSYTQSSQQYIQVNEVFRLSQNNVNTQSAETHNRLLARIAIDWHLEETCLSIKKDRQGKPLIYFHAQKLDIHFSLSHHGDFGAFSFLQAISES